MRGVPLESLATKSKASPDRSISNLTMLASAIVRKSLLLYNLSVCLFLNLSMNGLANSPISVVAPTNVKFGIGILMVFSSLTTMSN